jgi:chromosome segregation protein
LLKLKKLQILGFKSFCDRTELKFHGEGIAAIVGPNGCGKSNISDAIAWVLGEQSAKTLRGARMEDVIFAGTRDRKPTGMAEVTLTLVDPDVYEGSLAVEPEIEVVDEISDDDWDEAALREDAAKETEEYSQEVQPGQRQEVEAAGVEAASGAQQLDAAAHAEPGSQADATSPDVTAMVRSEVAGEIAAASAPEAAAAAEHRSPGVVLKIRRRKFKPAFKKGEIAVTRRLFRSGDSEYLLNGKLCRLRDIQDIFMGTGLGPESYAIIEQGRIGQILSSKPTDRRAIIEEAAGITRFKTRKRLAEARLEEAKLNLSRVNDIFEEVTRQMNSLKRQAAKAERFAKLRDEMRAKLRVVLASKFAQLQEERTGLNTALEELGEELRVKGEAIRMLDSEHGERTHRGYAIENESRQTRERIAELTRDADRAVQRQRTNEERCAELLVRSQAAEVELRQAEERLQALTAEREENQQVVANATAEVESARQQVAEKQQQAEAAASALAQVEIEQERRRVATMEALSAESAIHNRITRAQERISGLDRELSRLNSEIATGTAQVEAFGGQRGQVAFEFESASSRAAGLASQIDDTRYQIEARRADETESKRRLDGLRAEYASALGRKNSLEAVIAEHGYSTESVRRLLQSGSMQEGYKPVGVLADFLEVDDRYEHVVEDFLRDELNYVVVKSWDAADHGLEMLRTGVDGRATFLVHPEDSQARFSFLRENAVSQLAPTASATAGGIPLPLKNCIRVLNGFGRSLEVILPKLRDGYIVPDPAAARELALDNPDAFFLSQSGECFHNVTVTGGKQRSEGPLSLKRELRDVLRQLSEMEAALQQDELRVAALGREIGDLARLLDRLEGERREADKEALTTGHSLKQLEAEMARVSERVRLCEREAQGIVSERASTETQIGEAQADLSAREHSRRELEAATAAAQESLAGLRSARDAAVQAVSEGKAMLATVEERQRSAAATLSRLDAQLTELAGRAEALRGQQQSAVAEKAQREAENLQLAEHLVALAAERQLAEARELELQAESAAIRVRLAELEVELRTAREALDAARDRRGELAAQLAKLESDEQYMAETAMNDLGATAESLLGDETLPRITGDVLSQEDTAYREMRTRLDAMGPVNMMALEEYQEAAQRHEFLETQRKDLLDSIANTQDAIREIEIVSRQKFQEAFERINENFQATFKKLFGGGQGFMRLTDEENQMESGIDVVASPPGKKLQNVLLLSGGEKALTALSLLVGIFQYQPSPFCILDEVDAPLDEANVGRFTQLVREMSVQTQFVIITHSKKTMSISPVLYGVTMQEPGVSKIVSVRLGHETVQAVSA